MHIESLAPGHITSVVSRANEQMIAEAAAVPAALG
jgi:hypothetical protein